MRSSPPDQPAGTSQECVHLALQSSVLSSATYFLDAKLQLQFHNGTIYQYFAVPPAIWTALLAAASKGAYFNRHIRDRFPHLRLR